MMCMKNSPCAVCRRVEKPEQCDNKDCMLWRRWFLERWEQLRRVYQAENAGKIQEGDR